LDLSNSHNPTWSDQNTDAVRRWGEVISGQRVVGASLAVLSGTQWLDEWQSLSMARNLGVATMSHVQKLQWHRDEAARSRADENWQAVVSHLDRVLEAEPQDIASRYAGGFATYSLKNYNAAMADLEQCRGDANFGAESRHYYAHCLISLHQYAESIDELTQLLEESPANAHFLYLRAICFEQVDNPAAAIRDIDRSYQIPPQASASSIRSAALRIRNLTIAATKQHAWDAGLQGANCLLRVLNSIAETERTNTDHFNLACGWSLSVGATAGGTSPEIASKTAVLSENAVRELRLSISDPTTDRQRIIADSDLDDLHEFPAYQQLIAELAAGQMPAVD
jgi:tetratricopeptide (TPR) repeat protein